MKRIYVSLIALALSAIAFAQSTDKIKLANGQKIVVESTTDIQATLTMGMELTSTSASVNALEVKNSSPDNYIISNTLTKLKMNTNMMGQANNYDSENKSGNNEDISKVFDDKLNKPVDITIDNTSGLAVAEKKKQSQADVDETNATADIMKIFSDNASDDAIVSGAFEMVPKGKAIGDSWADTAISKEMKTIRTYTLKSISGNEAVIQSNVISTAVNKLNFQEMEFEVKSETKTNGEILTDISTGLVKKRTSVADITGSIQMMGQDMPISAKATSTNIYK
ncbi:MAG: hypothetical protein IPI88_06460 [Chitinophagaceae bacterium]|nr:hypothetical protein [Chitinophagaceae bacterium]MBK7306706.1 hypothetical protein [Chitinophagaceae bacterium]